MTLNELIDMLQRFQLESSANGHLEAVIKVRNSPKRVLSVSDMRVGYLEHGMAIIIEVT